MRIGDFVSGDVEDPPVETVQKLYCFSYGRLYDPEVTFLWILKIKKFFQSFV
jgi:hypothetical protein